MDSFLKKSLILLLTTVPLFAQNTPTTDRGQGLVTGDPFWRQAVGGAVLSLPHVQAQSAVIALDGGNIRAYSTAGTPLWDYSPRGRISPHVSRSREGTSYLSRTNGALIAVNRSGRELWRRFPGGPLSGKVVSGWDGRLFAPTGKKISCYTASGNLLWSRVFETDFSLAPQLDQRGGIIFALENNEVCRIGPFGDIQKWALANKPVVLLSVVYQAAPQVMVIYQDGTIEIPGLNDEWFVSAQGGANSRPLPKLPSGPLAGVSRGSELAAVFRDGKVLFVSLDEGSILWEGDSHIRETIKNGGRPQPEAEMLFDERGIYILSKDGACGFTQDGRRLWYTLLKNAAAIPAFGDDGVLYSGGQDWILYAYKMEERVLPGRYNLYGPVPAGSYGTGSPLSAYMIGFPRSGAEIKSSLNQISAAINSGRVENNELAWTSWLMTVASGQFAAEYRIRALLLLGKIGSSETVPWLTGLFRRENDTLVKAAAANAIGAIGVDPGGGAIRTFLDAVTYTGGSHDDRVLLAIVSATGALCRFSGPPLSETGVRILVFLSGYTTAPIVRRQANREIALLRE